MVTPTPLFDVQEVAVSDFKARCLGILEQVRATGRPVLVTKRGQPLAQILPPPKPMPPNSAYGCMAETAWEVADIVQSIDDDWEVLR
jgi:prevent-host-death family protein